MAHPLPWASPYGVVPWFLRELAQDLTRRVRQRQASPALRLVVGIKTYPIGGQSLSAQCLPTSHGERGRR